MRGRLFTLLSTVSLVLCVATCALWVRSYWHLDETGRPGGHFVHGVTSHRGTLWLRYRLDVEVAGSVVWRSWRAFSPSDVALLAVDADDADGDGIADRSLFILPAGTAVGADRAGVLGFGLYDTDPSRSGIRYIAGGFSWPPAERWRVILAPHWCPASLAAFLPAWWAAAALRQHRRTRSGLCPACGYDRRATPARCPECGAVPTVTAV